MIIDAHAHACGAYKDLDTIKKYLKKNNIDKIVLFSGEPGSNREYNMPYLSDTFQNSNFVYLFNGFLCGVTRLVGLPGKVSEGNEYVYQLACECPEHIINGYWVIPSEEQCLIKMEKFYYEKGFKVIKFHQCWHHYEIDSLLCQQIYAWADRHNLPVFVHLRSKEQVKKFIKMTNKFKNTTFIVAHMIGFKYISKYTKNPNVYYDLSSPQVYSRDLIKYALDTVGSGKLILGSDTPYGVDNLMLIQKELEKYHLSEEEMDNIKAFNFLYKLY